MLKLNRSSEQSGSEESQKDCFFTHQHRLKKKHAPYTNAIEPEDFIPRS